MEIVKDKADDGGLPFTSENGKEKPTYNPNKNYRWTPETQFVLSGDEYGATINALRKILASPEAQVIFAVERAHGMLNQALVRAVEMGDAVESEPPKK